MLKKKAMALMLAVAMGVQSIGFTAYAQDTNPVLVLPKQVNLHLSEEDTWFDNPEAIKKKVEFENRLGRDVDLRVTTAITEQYSAEATPFVLSAHDISVENGAKGSIDVTIRNTKVPLVDKYDTLKFYDTVTSELLGEVSLKWSLNKNQDKTMIYVTETDTKTFLERATNPGAGKENYLQVGVQVDKIEAEFDFHTFSTRVPEEIKKQSGSGTGSRISFSSPTYQIVGKDKDWFEVEEINGGVAKYFSVMENRYNSLFEYPPFMKVRVKQDRIAEFMATPHNLEAYLVFEYELYGRKERFAYDLSVSSVTEPQQTAVIRPIQSELIMPPVSMRENPQVVLPIYVENTGGDSPVRAVVSFKKRPNDPFHVRGVSNYFDLKGTSRYYRTQNHVHQRLVYHEGDEQSPIEDTLTLHLKEGYNEVILEYDKTAIARGYHTFMHGDMESLLEVAVFKNRHTGRVNPTNDIEVHQVRIKGSYKELSLEDYVGAFFSIGDIDYGDMSVIKSVNESKDAIKFSVSMGEPPPVVTPVPEQPAPEQPPETPDTQPKEHTNPEKEVNGNAVAEGTVDGEISIIGNEINPLSEAVAEGEPVADTTDKGTDTNKDTNIVDVENQADGNIQSVSVTDTSSEEKPSISFRNGMDGQNLTNILVLRNTLINRMDVVVPADVSTVGDDFTATVTVYEKDGTQQDYVLLYDVYDDTVPPPIVNDSPKGDVPSVVPRTPVRPPTIDEKPKGEIPWIPLQPAQPIQPNTPNNDTPEPNKPTPENEPLVPFPPTDRPRTPEGDNPNNKPNTPGGTPEKIKKPPKTGVGYVVEQVKIFVAGVMWWKKEEDVEIVDE